LNHGSRGFIYPEAYDQVWSETPPLTRAPNPTTATTTFTFERTSATLVGTHPDTKMRPRSRASVQFTASSTRPKPGRGASGINFFDSVEPWFKTARLFDGYRYIYKGYLRG